MLKLHTCIQCRITGLLLPLLGRLFVKLYSTKRPGVQYFVFSGSPRSSPAKKPRHLLNSILNEKTTQYQTKEYVIFKKSFQTITKHFLFKLTYANEFAIASWNNRNNIKLPSVVALVEDFWILFWCFRMWEYIFLAKKRNMPSSSVPRCLGITIRCREEIAHNQLLRYRFVRLASASSFLVPLFWRFEPVGAKAFFGERRRVPPHRDSSITRRRRTVAKQQPSATLLQLSFFRILVCVWRRRPTSSRRSYIILKFACVAVFNSSFA